MQNKKVVIISIIVLLAVFFGAGYVYKNNQSNKYENISTQELLKRPHSIVIGKEDAKVQLVEFFDPACGTCALYHYHVKEIMKENEGNIQLVLRYAPFHKNADYAVKMLEGAREQGLFLDTLEFMFQTQKYWVQNHTVNPKQLWNLLTNVKGLDMEKLASFMNNNKVDEIIKQDLQDVQTLKIDKTPTYFVNNKPLQTFGLDNLKKLINSEL